MLGSELLLYRRKARPKISQVALAAKLEIKQATLVDIEGDALPVTDEFAAKYMAAVDTAEAEESERAAEKDPVAA